MEKRKIKTLMIAIIIILLVTLLLFYLVVITPIRSGGVTILYPEITLQVEKSADNYIITVIEIYYKQAEDYHWYDYWLFKKPKPTYRLYPLSLDDWTVTISNGSQNLLKGSISEFSNNMSLLSYIDDNLDGNISVGDKFIIRGKLASEGKYLTLIANMIGDEVLRVQFRE